MLGVLGVLGLLPSCGATKRAVVPPSTCCRTAGPCWPSRATWSGLGLGLGLGVGVRVGVGVGVRGRVRVRY